MPLQAGDQTQVIENLRSQRAANISHRLQHFLSERLRLTQCSLCLLKIRGLRPAQRNFQRRQILPDLVMQFACDAALFGFVREDQLLANRAQVHITLGQRVRAFQDPRFQSAFRLLQFSQQGVVAQFGIAEKLILH